MDNKKSPSVLDELKEVFPLFIVCGICAVKRSGVIGFVGTVIGFIIYILCCISYRSLESTINKNNRKGQEDKTECHHKVWQGQTHSD